MEAEISKYNYGDYASGNYGAHTQAITIGELTFWFSYDTCVAFRAGGRSKQVSENVWGVTTGKHLNWIQSDHSKRIKHETFEKHLMDTLEHYKLNIKVK